MSAWVCVTEYKFKDVKTNMKLNTFSRVLYTHQPSQPKSTNRHPVVEVSFSFSFCYSMTPARGRTRFLGHHDMTRKRNGRANPSSSRSQSHNCEKFRRSFCCIAGASSRHRAGGSEEFLGVSRDPIVKLVDMACVGCDWAAPLALTVLIEDAVTA